MTPLHTDIIRTIEKHGPITSEDIAERLTELGYGGGTCFDEFKRQVSKIASKLKQSGKVIGDDIPQAKAKPMRVYRMVEAVTEECSATVQKSLTVADADMVAALDSLDTEREIQERQAVAETVTPDPEYDAYAKERELNRHTEVAIEAYEDGIRAAHKPPMTVPQALAGFGGAPHELNAFLLGVAFAEKHHGISQ